MSDKKDDLERRRDEALRRALRTPPKRKQNADERSSDRVKKESDRGKDGSKSPSR